MDLVIDIGNTLRKVAVFSEKGVLLHLFSEKQLTIPFFENLFKVFDLQRAIVSSVSKGDEEVLEWLDAHTRLVRFTHDCKLPITIKYATSETLGTDRIANAVGASALFPGNSVLSFVAGTCLIADFVNAEGEYLGGSIAPGLRMRFQALEHFTARLPLVEPEKTAPLIGNTTQTSILSGVINGIAAEIDGLTDRYRKLYPGVKVLFSGGDSELLQNFIKKRIFAAQNPILFGLHKILKLNASEI